jgi:hypothetical protein
MNLASKEYISKRGLGDAAQCRQTLFNLQQNLNEMVKENLIGNFLGSILHTTDDVFAEELDEDDVLAITQGVFPAIWLNITFNLDVHIMDIVKDVEDQFMLIQLP